MSADTIGGHRGGGAACLRRPRARRGATRLRDGRRARQGAKAVRPVDRPVPGGAAQARRLPDQPRRRAAHDRIRRRRARRRQSGLAVVRSVGAGLRRPGAARRLDPDASGARRHRLRRGARGAAAFPPRPCRSRTLRRRAARPRRARRSACWGRRHDHPSRPRHGTGRRRLPQGSARLARQALDAGEAGRASAQAVQGARLRQRVLQADGPRRLDRRRLAEAVRRPGPQPDRADRLHHRDRQLPARRRTPTPPARSIVAQALFLHGTKEQQDEWLPAIQRGERFFALGYSEPEAGSDLAALRTRAVRDGDDWVVNGQKLWSTGGRQGRLHVARGAHRPGGEEARRHQRADGRPALARHHHPAEHGALRQDLQRAVL